MVEHFHTEVIAKGKVGGKARAMVITSSIKRAIEYYKAVSKLLEERKSPFKAIVSFWCVVAKHNIRTQNKNVPVIDLKRIEELFSSHSLNTVFHCIRNHEYEIKMPEEVKITHQEIDYAGYRFKIPALCFGNMSE